MCYKLEWKAPANSESAPVHRYSVAVLDPGFGKILTIVYRIKLDLIRVSALEKVLLHSKVNLEQVSAPEKVFTF